MSDVSTFRRTCSYRASDWTNSLVGVAGSLNKFKDDIYDENEELRGLCHTRTEYFLQEYRQYKAATKMQSNIRAWLCTYDFQNKRKAAIMIQKNWRRYMAQRHFFKNTEKLLEEKLWKHYDTAAILIQKTFRGWLARDRIHNQCALKHMQLEITLNLLICLANKMRNILATHEIPGVYSLRNSKCLENVQNFLNCLKYRFHNNFVKNELLFKQYSYEKVCNEFIASAFSTAVPYYGPNYFGLCSQPPEDTFKQYEPIELKVITEYKKSKHDNHLLLLEETRRHEIQRVENLMRKEEQKSNFCHDVLTSMTRWKIWEDESININPDLFTETNRLDKFLSEVYDILDKYELKCHCAPKVDLCQIPMYQHLLEQKEVKSVLCNSTP